MQKSLLKRDFFARQLIYASPSFHTRPLEYQIRSSSYIHDIYDHSFLAVDKGDAECSKVLLCQLLSLETVTESNL